MNLFRNLKIDDITLDYNTLEEIELIMLNKGLEGNKNLKKLNLINMQLNSIVLFSLLKMLDKADEFKELHIEIVLLMIWLLILWKRWLIKVKEQNSENNNIIME